MLNLKHYFQKLKNKDPNVVLMLTSRAADGFWRERNEQHYDKVGNFVYTDIKDLKTPDWHKEDWQHNSSRPIGVV